jgi:hypothetical protein
MARTAETPTEAQVMQLTPNGRYRGPGGPDPKKSRAERETELLSMMHTQDGLEIILYLWKEAKGIPAGITPPGMIGTLVKQEMIPDLLAHEYPNG